MHLLRRMAWVFALTALALTGCGLLNETPSAEFLDAQLIVRPGVDDLGGETVREFVSILSRVQKPDGKPVELVGWRKTSTGYTLTARIASEIDLVFKWPSGGKIALLEKAEVDGESVNGLMFFIAVAGMPKISGPDVAEHPKPGSAKVAADNTIQEAEREPEMAAVAQPVAPASAVPPPAPLTPSSTPPAMAAAPAPSVPHLCTAPEAPVFACSTGKKRASVCATHSGSSEQLVYRLAPLEGVPEMEYPSAGASAAAAFQYGTQPVDGKPVTFLSFDKGSYRYVVYAGGVQHQGIVVEQRGKRIADLRCQGEAMASFDPAAWQRMGLAQDSRGLQLP